MTDSDKNTNKRSIWSKLFKYGLPPLITVGLCYVLFREQNLTAMFDYIGRECDFRWIGASSLLIIISFVVRAARWRMQLQASGINAPLHIVTYSIVGTYAVNLVFPRAGEIWRSGYIANRENTHFTTVLGAMVADRLADTMTVLLLLLLTFLTAGDAVEGFITRYPDAYNAISSALSSPWLYVTIGVAALALIWFMRHKSHNAHFAKLRQLLINMFKGFVAIFHMRGAWRWLILTVLLWGLYFASLVCCFMAFGFTRELVASHGLEVVAVCYVLSSVSMGIPANGGIGPFQAALVFGLGFYVANLNQGEALGFANTVLGAQILTIILCGIPTFIAITIDHRRQRKLKSILTPIKPIDKKNL